MEIKESTFVPEHEAAGYSNKGDWLHDRMLEDERKVARCEGIVIQLAHALVRAIDRDEKDEATRTLESATEALASARLDLTFTKLRVARHWHQVRPEDF